MQFPGISLFDRPVFTTGYLWVYHMGSEIPDKITVFHDCTMTPRIDGQRVRHYSVLPDHRMPVEDYIKVLILKLIL